MTLTALQQPRHSKTSSQQGKCKLLKTVKGLIPEVETEFRQEKEDTAALTSSSVQEVALQLHTTLNNQLTTFHTSIFDSEDDIV